MNPLSAELILVLIVGVGAMAFLYSSVGHAGASGYIAVMGLLSLPVTVVRPTSLLLNILVALIGSGLFLRNRHFDFRLIWPLVATSVPASFWGGSLTIDTDTLKMLLGVVLLVSAVFFGFRFRERLETRKAPIPWLLVSGALIGFFSGITGTGGGIFLTPLLLVAGWSKAKVASGVSVVFILCNSVSGLTSYALSGQPMEPLWYLAVPVVAFGYLGASLGAGKFRTQTLFLFLSLVLIVASGKLLLRL